MSETIAALTLDEAIETALVGHPMSKGRNYLGIEVEQLILHRQTKEQAPLEFSRGLIADLAEIIGGQITWDGEVIRRVDGEGYSFTMEPGGQLEIATDPRSSVQELDPTMDQVAGLVDERLRGTEYEAVSLGHTPVSKVADIALLPRTRYQIMDRTMTPRGRLTPNMMRATAGFQLTYDISDRKDAGQKLALLNRLAPVLVAVTANSRMVEGRDSGFASFRHNVWLHTDRDRVGVPPGCLEAETAVDGYIQFARRATMLFQIRDGVMVESPERSFEDLVSEGTVTLEDLELHLSSLFPYVRLRNYLEVRYLDAVEWPLARSVLALLSGLIYCPTATAGAQATSASLVPSDLNEGLRTLHSDAARLGLGAKAPDGRGFREIARELLAYSSSTLGGDTCQWASPADLEAVAARIS
jgi:glutamate--cysteine ligase